MLNIVVFFEKMYADSNLKHQDTVVFLNFLQV